MKFIRIVSETEHKRISLMEDNGKYRILKEINKPYASGIYRQLYHNPHKGIPTIISVEPTPTKIMVLEEFIDGCLLSDVMKALSLTQKEEIFYDLLEVVNHIHSLMPPVIHRDIKPENIIICEGKIKLIDFEIARNPNNQGKDTQVLGSAGYAAPEQFGFSESDKRSDIYALGVVYNVLMTNCLPKEKLTKRNRLVVEKSTHIDPDKRYQTVGEMGDELMRKQREDTKINNMFEKMDLFWKILGYIIYTLFVLSISLQMRFTDNVNLLKNTAIKVLMFLDFMIAAYWTYILRKQGKSWIKTLFKASLIWIVIIIPIITVLTLMF